jgi:alpha-1,2-mannosyltransferase
MIFQILGSIIFTFICLFKYQPNVFCDTTGFAFSFYIVDRYLSKSKLVSYVHYPFISQEMIETVEKNIGQFNNN